MKTKDYLLWLLVIPIGISFIVVSFLVYLNKGNSRKLIRAKLKTGAFLLSVSYFSACGKPGGGPEIMCYDPALPENYISVDRLDSVYKPGDSLRGAVNEPTFPYYAFAFYKNGTADTLAAGWLKANDNAFDGGYEPFSFIVPDRIGAGDYELRIFGEATNNFTFSHQFMSQAIKIANEN